jgi:hypothetical protein
LWINSHSKVISQMAWHRFTVIGDETKMIRLTPEQNVRIERATSRRAGITNDPGFEIRRGAQQVAAQ